MKNVIEKYRPAILAMQYQQQGNEYASAGALEKLISNLDLGEDGPKALNAIRSSQEGNKMLAQLYAGEYQKALGSSKISDLFTLYSDYFKKYLGEESYGLAQAEFGVFGGDTYESISNKLMAAQEVLESKRTDIKEEEKKKAQSTIEKYQKIMYPIQSFEGLEFKKLGNPIEESAMKKILSEMYKPKPKENAK